MKDAIKASDFLRAKVAVPMHYNTFDIIEADPEEFVRGVEQAGGRAVVVRPGKSITL